jgi:phosphoglycerate dehydrogenase-like enzyme
MPFKMVFLPPQSDTTRKWAGQLAHDVRDSNVIVPETIDEAKPDIVDAEAAFGTILPEVLELAGKLRWLAAPAIAPPAGYYYPALIEHPVQVTNFRGIFNEHIAAHIMSFVLAFSRGLHYYVRRQLAGEWKREPHNSGIIYLPESTALIVGVGGIGAETARLCTAFGMRVIGIDARLPQAPEGVAELHRPAALDSLLPKADFVILTIPHTPQTEGLMNAERFARMKRSAFFINIGRGKTTKLDALNAALREGTIGGAGLDVYEIEPLPKDHPLWTAPNTLMTPHSAGFGPYLDERRYAILAENARRFAAGEPLGRLVDKANWF